MDANSLQSMSPSQKDELMRTVQAQVALANMQEMLSVSELDLVHALWFITATVKLV